MTNFFSSKATEVLGYSKEETIRLRNKLIEPGHLLLAIMREGNNKATEILHKLNVNFESIKLRIEHMLASSPMVENDSNWDAPMADETSRILKMSILEARLYKSEATEVEHILLAILKDPNCRVNTALELEMVNYDTVSEQLQKKSANPKAGMGFIEDDDDEDDDLPPSNPETGKNDGFRSQQGTQTTTQKPSNETPVLDNFGVDMTQAAMNGSLDPVVGRETEIERVAQILSRRKKNNPVLIGEPGVGKSAIVEGLALRIVQKKVSRTLFDKRVVMLDMAAVVAGTKYRGQFEERIRSIINELQKNKNVILFIDEIHTIVGAGSAAGTMDAANMLKPALARGEVQCIGATTLDEYRKSIEKDGALERRFQKIVVAPTTPDETLQILQNIKDKYEEHHNVSYTDEALEACVKLSERYITDRHLPDKAIDVLDEAGSRVHLTNISVPKEIEEQEKMIDEARARKAEAVKLQNFELAASYRDKEKELTARLDQLKAEWEARLRSERQSVGEEEIANVVSMMSQIPVHRMAQTEGVRLAGMKQELQSRVIAQDDAIAKVVKAIMRSRVGLKDPNRPIGTFLFLGPTGVGKTFLAKQLAEFMFGSADALIRIDMSEYMEKYTVSRMVGAAPGYVGYEEGGQLTEKVRRRPYSIVLLDEIEKAHPDVFNILLQVLDEGRLTDNTGRTIDFKNTVIIMTSNIGTRQLKEFGRGVGFASHNPANEKELSNSVIQKALHKTFSPEFLNRLDEIITFDQLSLEAIEKMVGIELKKLEKRIESIGYKMTVSDEAKHFLATKGYDVQYGARPLHRALQTHIEDGISEQIIAGNIAEGDTIAVSLAPEGDALAIAKAAE